MENIVLVVAEKKEFEYPKHWLKASDCRKLANSWENKEIKDCVDTIMASIREVAQKGGDCYAGHVRTSRPSHFYEVLEEIFVNLGYDVTVPNCPSDNKIASKIWGFSWKKEK